MGWGVKGASGGGVGAIWKGREGGSRAGSQGRAGGILSGWLLGLASRSLRGVKVRVRVGGVRGGRWVGLWVLEVEESSEVIVLGVIFWRIFGWAYRFVDEAQDELGDGLELEGGCLAGLLEVILTNRIKVNFLLERKVLFAFWLFS